MDINAWHLHHPGSLWLLAAIPFIAGAYFITQPASHSNSHIGRFIDSHLLPYLLVHPPAKKRAAWMGLIVWSLAWILLTVALAGPRWNRREVDTYSKDQSLVILLDLSSSMNVEDIKPSRLVRAKQKLEDLVQQSKGAKLGLVAFAADPHLISPITDDKETLRHLLPSLDTDLVYVQGSRLSPALEMARVMLEAEPGQNKAVLIITDGGFEDASALSLVKKMQGQGLTIHTMGMGTSDGAPLKDVKQKGAVPFSRLEKEKLQELSRMGGGHYLEGGYQEDAAIILEEMGNRAEAQQNNGKKEIWDEGFFWVALPALPLLLYWFRKRSLFALCFLFAPIEGGLFQNNEQLGEEYFLQGDYNAALQQFDDPYRKGVAAYRAEDYKEAENYFKQSVREEVAFASAYNLGNALAKQQQYKEGIAAYEKALEIEPGNVKAQENLDLLKKLQEEKEQQEEKKEEKPDSEKQDSNENNQQEDESDSTNPEEQEEEQSDESQTEDKELPEQPANQPEENKKSQEEIDADQWLNQIENDPKQFLKNKFFIESKKNGTKEGIDPW
ncbi:MAG: VWA domain-containing protein [Parachlamydia sp.]|jgi:Ca-activated chloride channel family protein|nr:VWA domain-containing protein [Parachlamydia sp.]